MTCQESTLKAERGPGLSALPDHARARLIDRMTEYVTIWFRERAEEVLDDPGAYESDIHGVRWQICGGVAEDLHYDYGEAIEELIQEAYEKAGLPTSVATPRRKSCTKTGTARSRRVES